MITGDPLRSLRESTIEPSAGFTLRVMAAVRVEALILKAATTPWKLGIPWFVVCLGVFCVQVTGVFGMRKEDLAWRWPTAVVLPPWEIQLFSACAWILGALLLSLSALILSNRFFDTKRHTM